MSPLGGSKVLIGVMGGLAACALLASCGKGSPDTADTTPPALSWSALNLETKERQEFQGNGNVTAEPNERYFVVFKANDSGGVKAMSLGGEASWICTMGEVGQKMFATYAERARRSTQTTTVRWRLPCSWPGTPRPTGVAGVGSTSNAAAWN